MRLKLERERDEGKSGVGCSRRKTKKHRQIGLKSLAKAASVGMDHRPRFILGSSGRDGFDTERPAPLQTSPFCSLKGKLEPHGVASYLDHCRVGPKGSPAAATTRRDLRPVQGS